MELLGFHVEVEISFWGALEGGAPVCIPPVLSQQKENVLYVDKLETMRHVLILKQVNAKLKQRVVDKMTRK